MIKSSNYSYVTLLSLCLFTSFTHAEDPTYEDVQAQRQLSITKNEAMNEQSLEEAKRAHRNRMKVLDNDYLNLLKIEKGLKSNATTASSEDPKVKEMRQQQSLQRQLARQKDDDINKLIAEMESQIFLVDVYEVAGLIRGEFWYQGANEVKTDNAIFGDWLIKQVTFDGAVVVPINPSTGIEDSKRTKTLRLMSEDEAISRFKRAQAFRDQIIENKLSEVSLGGFPSNPATFVPNSSPADGLMFR
jgi:hypothetical protein